MRIGSTAEIEIDDGKLLRVELVLPAHADINAGRISVLTPVGAAVCTENLNPDVVVMKSAKDRV